MLDQDNICLSIERQQAKYKSISPEIVQTSSFQFDNFQHYVNVNTNYEAAYTYARGENPTLAILEKKIAKLEKGECAKSFCFRNGSHQCHNIKPYPTKRTYFDCEYCLWFISEIDSKSQSLWC